MHVTNSKHTSKNEQETDPVSQTHASTIPILQSSPDDSTLLQGRMFTFITDTDIVDYKYIDPEQKQPPNQQKLPAFVCGEELICLPASRRT